MGDEAPRAAFDATLDEFADVQLRLLQRSPAGRGWRRTTILVNCGLYGLVSLVILLLAGPTGSAAYLLIAVATSLGIGALGGYLSLSSYNRTFLRRTRQFLEEQFGGPGPFAFEIELRPDGVWTRQLRGESRYPWAEVLEMGESADGIEIRLRAGMIVVRNRGFAMAAERQEFLKLGRAHILESRQGQ